MFLVMFINLGSINFKSSDAINNSVYIKANNSCFGYFDIIDKVSASKLINSENEIIGESVIVSKDKLNNFLCDFGINILKKYYASERLIIEGVSKKLPYKNANQQFNVQISIYDNIAKIGSPALLDSF